MTEIVVAAAPDDEARATAIADALRALGFNAGVEAADDVDMIKAVDRAFCVVALWSVHGAAAPWLAMQATLALERRKLVCVELDEGATPEPYASATKARLIARDRLGFKSDFVGVVAAIEEVSRKRAKMDAMTEALVKARTAFAPPARVRAPSRFAGMLGFAAVIVFAGAGIAAGASAVLRALRTEPATAAIVSTPIARAATNAPYGVTLEDLRQLSWRDAAAKIDGARAARIKQDANNGDPLAQTVACLGHTAGVEGFLPSPTAAASFCDAAAAQNFPAALYLSWQLQRNAPYAGGDEATARARLARAAQQGWTAALIDYGLQLAPDDHAPLDAQVQAGRLWQNAAENGDARGQFYYARWLRDSPAGPRNPTAAIPYLERAAAHDQVDALHMLATLYRDGVGVPKDRAQAITLYERAAAKNFAPSMFNLADLVRNSDRAQAADLYRRLACMHDEHEISAMAGQRLRAIGQSATCARGE